MHALVVASLEIDDLLYIMFDTTTSCLFLVGISAAASAALVLFVAAAAGGCYDENEGEDDNHIVTLLLPVLLHLIFCFLRCSSSPSPFHTSTTITPLFSYFSPFSLLCSLICCFYRNLCKQ